MDDALLIFGGAFNIALIALHVALWKLLSWQTELRALRPANRAVMQLLNLALIYLFGLMAYVSLFHRSDLLGTELGRALLLAFAGLWVFRGCAQVGFFGYRRAWSNVLTAGFLIAAVAYGIPALT